MELNNNYEDFPTVRVNINEIDEAQESRQLPRSIRIIGDEVDGNFNLNDNGTLITPDNTEMDPAIQNIPFLNRELNQDETINELNRMSDVQHFGSR